MPINYTRHLGITGTQRGANDAQIKSLRVVFERCWGAGFRYLHHGDCIGVDAEAHDMALYRGYKIVIHPPLRKEKRANCGGAEFTLPPANYLERNHDIVNSCVMLVGVPGEAKMLLRSGTWATIRYALQKKIEVTIVLPNGEITNNRKGLKI